MKTRKLVCLESEQGGYGLIQEGSDGAFEPTVVSVTQKGKRFYFKGAGDVNESVNDGLVIVESVQELDLIDEGKQTTVKDGMWLVEGPFQQADKKNANGRVYSRKLFERLIADDNSTVQNLIKERGMHGQVEHPKDGRSDLMKSALIVTSLALQEDGIVWGRAELQDTPAGRVLQAHTMRGNKWGVSSRGRGTVHSGGRVDESDFVLDAFDAVAKPSVAIALPKPVQEKKQEVNTQEDNTLLSVKLVESVIDVCGASCEGSDMASQLKLTSALITQFGRVVVAIKEGTVKPSVSTDLLASIFSKLNNANESVSSLSLTVDAAIHDSIDALKDESNDKSVSVDEVVASVQQQLVLSANELDTLRQESETVRDTLAESCASLKLTQCRLADTLKEVGNCEDQIVTLESELACAIDIVSETITESESVTEDYDAETSVVVEESEIMEANHAVNTISRHTLPRGLVSSSTVTESTYTPSRNLNPSVRLASVAVHNRK